MSKLPKRKSMSPQEKKAMSYKKDRRNTYGENDKASRKKVPKSKAIAHRKLRRTEKLNVTDVKDKDFDALKKLPKPSWKKSPDEPLGAILERNDGRYFSEYGHYANKRLVQKRIKKIGAKK